MQGVLEKLEFRPGMFLNFKSKNEYEPYVNLLEFSCNEENFARLAYRRMS